MNELSRRAFLGVSVGALSALHGEGSALAALRSEAIALFGRAGVDRSSALNLGVFLQNKQTLGLTGVVSMRAVEGELGNYARATLFLFPYKRSASTPNMRAFLPGRGEANPLVATVAMAPGGLPPDEYFCNYVLKVPRQSFISFSVGTPFVRGAEKRPWHTNVDNIGNGSVGIGWTSSNLNHPWFAGSRWIPAGDDNDGRHWRARIIEGLRQASAVQASLVAARSADSPQAQAANAIPSQLGG